MATNGIYTSEHPQPTQHLYGLEDVAPSAFIKSNLQNPDLICLCTGDMKGDVEAPKQAAVAAKEDGRTEDVDFKNLSIEEAFQVLGVSYTGSVGELLLCMPLLYSAYRKVW